MVVSSKLKPEEKTQLMEILQQHSGAIGWAIANLKVINPDICTHKIHFEETAKPVCQALRRLNPVKEEVL